MFRKFIVWKLEDLVLNILFMNLNKYFLVKLIFRFDFFFRVLKLDVFLCKILYKFNLMIECIVFVLCDYG